MLAWEKRIRAMGNRLPIHVGCGPATIKNIISLCPDFGDRPINAIYQQTGAQCYQADDCAVAASVAGWFGRSMAADPNCLIAHFHFYPFGGFAKTAAYADAVAHGQIRLLPKGGFDVLPPAA